MARLRIIEDVASQELVYDAEVDNVLEALYDHYDGVKPSNSHLYVGSVSYKTRVDTNNPKALAELLSLPEDEVVYFVTYPEGIGLVLGAALFVGAVTAVAFLLKPKVPSVAAPNTQQKSSNNELAERTNKARLLARIPDIYGKVISTPDLIQEPYKKFIDHQEVEYAYMCVGRGSYLVENVKDDTTLIKNIAGASVAVYEPFTSPNSGMPSLTIGRPINEPLYSIKRITSVNGQTLRPPNNVNRQGSNWKFVAPNILQWIGEGSVDFTEDFEVGDKLTVKHHPFVVSEPAIIVKGYVTQPEIRDPETGAITQPEIREPDQVVRPAQYGLGAEVTLGTFEIQYVNSKELGFTDASWETTQHPNGTNQTPPAAYAAISSNGEYWVGGFVVDDLQATSLVCNFVAAQGMYKAGENQEKTSVEFLTVVEAVDENDTVLATYEKNATIVGSSKTRDQRAVTVEIDLTNPVGTVKYNVKARRLTPEDKNFKGTVVDEVRWRDLYTSVSVTLPHFGNVTTVQSVTYATAGALSLKERKLNMEVTRKIPVRSAGWEYQPSTNAADILCAVAQDPFIGGRKAEELDFDNIYSAVDTLQAYFGTPSVGQFNYTFDKTNFSFEETVQSIASTIFCRAYRRGSVLRIRPDLPTDDAVLLFNHRNKIPHTEIRTVRFGTQNDHDGIAYKYVDPKDSAMVTIYIPEDRSAKKPKEVDSIGVRTHEQAHLHAHREYRRLLYQNTLVEFNATQEADLMLVDDKMLVADNTRPDTIDGEIVDHQGLALELSQPVTDVGAEPVIFLQLQSGKTEAINITKTSDPFVVLLVRPPSEPLVTDSKTYAKTSYIITDNNSRGRVSKFVVTEKDPQSDKTINLRGVNFDLRVYEKDNMYKETM